MTTPALRGFFTVVLPFTLLFAPAPLHGQAPDARSVVVLPFGFLRARFLTDMDMDRDLGRAFAADAATQIEGRTTYT